MDFQQARAALSTLFSSTWGNTSPILWEDSLADTPTGPWVRFSVQPTTSKLQSWDGDRQNFQEFGIVCVQVMTRVGTGTAQSDAMVKKVKDYLRGKRIGDLTTLEATVSQDGPDGHGWWQVRVLIRFHYFDRAAG